MLTWQALEGAVLDAQAITHDIFLLTQMRLPGCNIASHLEGCPSIGKISKDLLGPPETVDLWKKEKMGSRLRQDPW